jgi:hypothetical protein
MKENGGSHIFKNMLIHSNMEANCSFKTALQYGPHYVISVQKY